MALQQISSSQSSPEIPINENFVAVEPAAMFAYNAATSSGLIWGYYGGRINGTSIANGTVTLANGTNYIVALRSTGVVSASTSTTNWNASGAYMRLYQAVAASSVVTSYQDHRLGARGVLGTGTAGRQAIWVPARSMSPSATGGCAALATIASAASQPDIQTLDFDTTTQEFAQFSVAMPKRWDLGTVTFQPVWSHAATTVNFGAVFQLQGVAVSNDDNIAVAYGTAQTSTDTGGTTNDIYIGPESSAITLAGTPAAEDMAFFRIGRVPANGSDTLAIDARLHGVVLFINTIAENDL